MQFAILWFTLILRASEDYMRQWVSDPLSRSTELQFCLWNFFYIFLAFSSPLLLSFTTIRWGNTMHAKSYITLYTYVCNDQSMANIVTIQLNHLPCATHLPSPIFGLLKTSTIGLCPVIIAWLDLINVIQTQNFSGKIDSAVMLTCHLTWKDNLRGKLSKQNI